MKQTSPSWTNILLLFGAGGAWGFQFLLNKIALVALPAPFIAFLRILLGVITLMLVLTFLGKEERPANSQKNFWEAFPDFLLIGITEAALPTILVPWAQQHLASSIAAVLMGTIPLFTTLLELFFLPGARLTQKRFWGIGLGFLGIIILMLPDFIAEGGLSAFGGGSHSILLPMGAVLFSAFSFAVAMLLTKSRLSPHLGPIESAQGILLGGTLTLLPLLFFLMPEIPQISLSYWETFSFPWHAFFAVVGLGIFCSGLAYTLFVMLIHRAGPSFASMSNYLVPMVGAFLGIVFAGEHFSITLLVALVVILFSLWLSAAPAVVEG